LSISILFFSPGEAIEKMLQEKKISTKINYEVLKNLNTQQQDNQELHTARLVSNDAMNFSEPLVYVIAMNISIYSTYIIHI